MFQPLILFQAAIQCEGGLCGEDIPFSSSGIHFYLHRALQALRRQQGGLGPGNGSPGHAAAVAVHHADTGRQGQHRCQVFQGIVAGVADVELVGEATAGGHRIGGGLQLKVCRLCSHHRGGFLQDQGIPQTIGVDEHRCGDDGAGYRSVIHGGVDLNAQALACSQVIRGPVHFIPGIAKAVGQAAPLAAAVQGGIAEAIEAHALWDPQ